VRANSARTVHPAGERRNGLRCFRGEGWERHQHRAPRPCVHSGWCCMRTPGRLSC